MLKSILFTYCFILCVVAATGQEYCYARYDVKDGLADSVVYHGVEDKDGFLWYMVNPDMQVKGIKQIEGNSFLLSNIYEEISYLATYLELEKTKFEDKFSYTVTVAPYIDPFDWFIPPMILQPYVENSIPHGMRYRNDKEGHIRVSFTLDQHYLICVVEDNGVGRKKAGQYKSEIPIEYQSKGMTLTVKRIDMLNKNNATPVLIAIKDLET